MEMMGVAFYICLYIDMQELLRELTVAPAGCSFVKAIRQSNYVINLMI